MSTPIGVVGLGNMGLPIVARLVGTGHGVVALARNETKAAAAQKLGATVVAGGPVGVEQATLAVMAGGEPGALDRAVEVVAPFTGRFVRCGPSGSGQVAKACNQLVVVTTLQVVSEALVLAKAAGADVSAVREALLGGFAASRILELQGQRMIDSDFAPRGTVKMQRKDVHVIEDLARQSGITALPAFNVAAANVVRLDENGGGGLNHAALITVLEQDTGVTL